MTVRSFLFGFVAAVVVFVAGAAIAGVVFDLRIEKKDGTGTALQAEPDAEAETLSTAEERELQRQDWNILVYCSEDRSFSAQMRYARAIEALIGLAREKPNAVYTGAGQFSAGPAPTMQQYLVDEAAVVRRKCSELGDEGAWADDVQHLEDAAQQLAIEGGA